ncbi:MAG: nicotinamide mononucleotide transporter [Candidatus Gastranaerophilales bacterium]|nr:nicotinamide mononucleotide transporter [Candidatus Gastranaerophilales bacterium]
MKLKDFLLRELKGFTFFEKIFFPSAIIAIITISFILNDNKIALISAICGLSYTFLAGKGKISCYFLGLMGTFCYCFIAYKNALYGNLALYAFYVFPMHIIGIIKWSKNLKKDTGTIIKTYLTKKEKMFYFPLMFVMAIIMGFVLTKLGGKTPFIDSIATTFSIFGQIFTVKRCIEQWYVWFVVNVLTLSMWIIAYINGSNCFVTIIMWAIYTFFAIYFFQKWKKELNSNEENI